MENNYPDTNTLWKGLITLINLLLITAILFLAYLSLEPTIDNYLSQPKYSKEELQKYNKQRIIAQRADRADNWDLIENGIHIKTGLKDDEHLQLVISQCLSCHSAKLITQNRATYQGWNDMIDWMQATQGLPDLGSSKPKILEYLAEHYAPQKVGRRKNLNIAEIEWYMLQLTE